ncbi:glycosyltransferase family 2 protein [Desulforudis sp. DRI-14]|uniref:glycosyltransferase family 2 protein n=1 Tax=Desulforudis sp. DRI-14 TaxID=3459793 RepID=UPI0040436682
MVSVIIPVFNEEKHITGVLKGLFRQDWIQEYEIVLVDGQSEDGTLPIIADTSRDAPAHCKIRVLSNPKRHIPISLNLACREARGEIIIRLDGHTYPPSDYVSRSVRALEAVKYKGIVGGRWDIVPAGSSACAKAIAAAVSHPAGIGNPAYRTHRGSEQGLITVDTVPFGAYPRHLWEELGGYDEAMLANEDYDFIWRARQKGYSAYLDPNLVLQYVARGNLKLLWKQYFRYGYWVSHFLVKHRVVPTPRKLAPLSLLASVVVSMLISPWLGFTLIGTYLCALAVVAGFEALKGTIPVRAIPSFAGSLATLHWAYGLGNLVGLPAALGRLCRRSC